MAEMLVWGTGWSSVGHKQQMIAFCSTSSISKIWNISKTIRYASQWLWFQISSVLTSRRWFLQRLWIQVILINHELWFQIIQQRNLRRKLCSQIALCCWSHCRTNLARTIVAQLLLMRSMECMKIINLEGYTIWRVFLIGFTQWQLT